MPVMILIIFLVIIFFILFMSRFAENIGDIFFKIFINPLTTNCRTNNDKKENIQNEKKDGE